MESVKPQSFDGQENLDALRSDEVVELEIPESESPEDRLLRRSEVLDEQSQEKLARLVSDADKIAKTKDIFSGKQYVSDEALQDFETFLLPEESGSDKPDALKTAIDSYQGEGRSAGNVREFNIRAALDYFEIRQKAEQGLEQYIVDRGDDLTEVESEGVKQVVRVLRPQPGDSFSRMQMTASMFADGAYISPKSFMRDTLRADESRQERGGKRREARVRDLGNFSILKRKILSVIYVKQKKVQLLLNKN